MSSRIIDVAIGLTLVFALTSLLISTLVEALASIIKMRGRVLIKAITSFVGDDQTLARMLLKQPLLVSLAPQTKGSSCRRPSYIAPDVMVTSLLSYLIKNYTQGVRPASPAELVAAVKTVGAAAAGPDFSPANDEFRNGLEGLLHGVENDWPGYEQRLQAWYDSVTQRSIGWYKRWSSLCVFFIGLLVAGSANIDPIVIGPRLWNDAALRETVVEAGQEASRQYGTQVGATASKTTDSGTTSASPAPPDGPAPTGSPQSGALIKTALPRRADPETRAVAHDFLLLEQSLAAATKAVPIDSKQDTAAVRNQIFSITGKLPNLLDATRVPDDNSATFLFENEKAKLTVDLMLRQLDELIPRDIAEFQVARSLRDHLQSSIVAERAALDKKKAQQKRDRDCEAVDDPNAKQLCMRMSDLTQLHDAGLPIGWSPPAWPDVIHYKADAKCFEDAANNPNKDISSCDHTADWRNIGVAIIGWIITAIAATLGAPFWFDMLGRLVKLRGSGTRVDGDSAKAGAGADQKASTLSASTPATPDTAVNREPMSDALNEREKSLSQSEIERIQRALQDFGAAVTGSFDGPTRDAIKKWQKTRNAEVTGELTPTQIEELLRLTPGDSAYAG